MFAFFPQFGCDWKIVHSNSSITTYMHISAIRYGHLCGRMKADRTRYTKWSTNRTCDTLTKSRCMNFATEKPMNNRKSHLTRQKLRNNLHVSLSPFGDCVFFSSSFLFESLVARMVSCCCFTAMNSARRCILHVRSPYFQFVYNIIFYGRICVFAGFALFEKRP